VDVRNRPRKVDDDDAIAAAPEIYG